MASSDINKNHALVGLEELKAANMSKSGRETQEMQVGWEGQIRLKS